MSCTSYNTATSMHSYKHQTIKHTHTVSMHADKVQEKTEIQHPPIL